MIKIYTTPQCHYCHVAKDYFKSKNLQYEDVNLVGNPQAQQLVMSKTGMFATPVIEINDKFILGFDKEKIDTALKQ